MQSRIYRKVKILSGRYPIPMQELEAPRAPDELLISDVAREGQGNDAEILAPTESVSVEESRQEGERILQEARRERDELLESARAEVSRMREEAIRQGYEAGKEQAAVEARESVKQELEQYQVRFVDLMQSMIAEKQKILEEAEPEVVDLALEIATAILKEEVKTNRDAPVQMVREAIDRLGKKENLSIYLNPDDLESFNIHKGVLEKESDLGEIRVVPDHRVDRGGCIVESNGGQVDGRLEVQLGEMKRSLGRLKREGKNKTRKHI